MTLLSEIQAFAHSLPAELKESKGTHEMTAVIAERKAFLSTQKLQYVAKFRILDDQKIIRFTELLKESGAGMSTGGDFDSSPGFGFKVETTRSGMGGREGTIQEQSILFGKKFEYRFDIQAVRTRIEELANAQGYRFEYLITTKGL